VSVSDLPALNATLNGIAACFLLAGYVCIRRGLRGAHRASMLTAFTASALFLVSYVVYHASAGSKPFPGTGIAKTIYLAILVTHIILAAVILPMALVTLGRALGGRFDRHVRLARWTLPLWLYVSVTGVVIYWMLYRMSW
jgi:putative membrane protein